MAHTTSLMCWGWRGCLAQSTVVGFRTCSVGQSLHGVHARLSVTHLKGSCATREESGFSGGSVVKNPPANAGDMGSILDPGRSHTLWGNQAPRHNYLRLHSRPTTPKAHVPWCPYSARKATAMRSLHTATREWPPFSTSREKPVQQQRPGTAKNKTIFLKKKGREELCVAPGGRGSES